MSSVSLSRPLRPRDLDRSGKVAGHFAVPWSRNESGWGNLLTPLAVIANGDGPTVLLTGGNHGDEYEGPVALRRIIGELEPADVRGRIIIVPGLNQAALQAGRRLSPIDGGNLNRSFPGDPRGTPTQRVADFVYRELVSRADVVLDVHSGGTSMVFTPLVATHQLDDPALAAETARYLASFGTDLAVVAEEPDPVGLLDHAVEALGKIFLTTEIGGGGAISAATAAVAVRGIRNTLHVAGVLAGEPELDRDHTPTFARMHGDGSAITPIAGLLEPLVDPGAEVGEGDQIARVHPLERLDVDPLTLVAPRHGLVIMRHNSGLVAAGDPVIAVATPTSAVTAAQGG